MKARPLFAALAAILLLGRGEVANGVESQNAQLPQTLPAGSIWSVEGPYHMYDQSLALVIGESNYTGSTEWAKLEVVPDEVKLVSDGLTAAGFTTKTFENLSGSELVDEFRRFLKRRVGRDTRLLIFYVGHGYSDENHRGYIVPVDAQDSTSDDFYSSIVAMSELQDMARAATAKHVLMIFDSCFSGSVFNSRQNLRPARLFLKDIDRPGLQYITSGSASESVPDSLDFSRTLVLGLRGDADETHDGIVSANELGYWLKVNIAAANIQTPQYGSDPIIDRRGGDMVFADNSGAIPVDPPEVEPDDGSGPRLSAIRSNGVPEDNRAAIFTGIDIIYFQKSVDGERILSVLNSNKIPYSVQVGGLADTLPVNAIGCGPDVPVEAIKRLATLLLQAGVPLKTIQTFRDPSAKLHRLEMLSITKDNAGKVTLGGSTLTQSQIDALESCPAMLRNT